MSTVARLLPGASAATTRESVVLSDAHLSCGSSSILIFPENVADSSACTSAALRIAHLPAALALPLLALFDDSTANGSSRFALSSRGAFGVSRFSQTYTPLELELLPRFSGFSFVAYSGALALALLLYFM